MFIKNFFSAVVEALRLPFEDESPPAELAQILFELEVELSFALGEMLGRSFHTSSLDPYVELHKDDLSGMFPTEGAVCRIYYAHKKEKPVGVMLSDLEHKDYLAKALEKYARALKVDSYILNDEEVFLIN